MIPIPIDWTVWVAFAAGIGLGFVLNQALRWVTDIRFRLARWASRHRAGPHGVR